MHYVMTYGHVGHVNVSLYFQNSCYKTYNMSMNSVDDIIDVSSDIFETIIKINDYNNLIEIIGEA